MKKVLAVVVVLLVGVGAWWYLSHRDTGRGDRGATAAVPQPNGSSVRAASEAPSEPAELAISVVDAKGPVDAAVRIDGEEVLAKRTAAGGTLRLSVPAGEYAISASADGHLPGSATKKVAAGEHARVEILLATGGVVLTGIVTDATGGPVASARVDAARLGALFKPGHAIAMAVTGADGKYKLTVPDGPLLVGASHPDYAPQSRYLDVGAAGATADFALVPGGVLEGIVRDAKTKEPVAGARVMATADQATIQLAEAQTHVATAGPEGRFRIAGLRPGAYELHAAKDQRRSLAPTRIGLGVAEQLADVEILVGVGPVVRGKIIDDKGAPAAGASAVAMGEGTRDDEAIAKADGTFELAGLPPGHYFLRGQGNGFVPDRMVPVEIATKDVENVVVHVAHGEKITGHVEPRQLCDVRMDLDDTLLASGTMPMLLAPVTTDADGNFELSPVSPGKTTLAARCPSGDQGELSVVVTASLAPQVIAVKAGASIAGRVLDGDGKPVPNATVVASARGTSEHVQLVNGVVTSGVQGLTNAAGAYELKGLAAATYGLSVMDRGRPLRMRSAPPAIVLGANDHKTSVDLAVDRATGKISGTVTGPDGKPLADAWVSARQSLQDLVAGMLDHDQGEGSRTITMTSSDEGGGGGMEIPPALTDASGHYELAGLPQVKYQVIAEAQAGKLRARAADITPDATVDLHAQALTSLGGTVHGAAGPTALFSVEVVGPTQVERSFTQGTFEIARVDPGNYTVKVTSADGNGEASVTVIAGQQATVDITLAANAAIVGKLVDASGKPGANLPITVADDSGDGHMSISLQGMPPTSGDDGSFRLETKPGKKIFVVMTQPRPFAKRGLVLAAGQTLDLGTVDYTTATPGGP